MGKARSKFSGDSESASAYKNRTINGLSVSDVYGRIAHSPKGISYIELARDFGISEDETQSMLMPVLEHLSKRGSVYLDGRSLKATTPPSRLVIAKVTEAQRGNPVYLEPIEWDDANLPKPRFQLPSARKRAMRLNPAIRSCCA